MIAWKRKRLEAKDGRYTCDGVEVSKDKFHEIVAAQKLVQENLAVGYEKICKNRAGIGSQVNDPTGRSELSEACARHRRSVPLREGETRHGMDASSLY